MALSRRALLSAALLLTATCRRRSAAAPDEALRAARQRLLGSWLLIQFEPAEPLEPMLYGLLAAQFGVLTMHFDGSRVQMQGVGVAAERSYEILGAANDQLSLVLRDAQGIAYHAVGAFEGADLRFMALTAPWRGRGLLRRL